jgi:hypothetical protein
MLEGDVSYYFLRDFSMPNTHPKARSILNATVTFGPKTYPENSDATSIITGASYFKSLEVTARGVFIPFPKPISYDNSDSSDDFDSLESDWDEEQNLPGTLFIPLPRRVIDSINRNPTYGFHIAFNYSLLTGENPFTQMAAETVEEQPDSLWSEKREQFILENPALAGPFYKVIEMLTTTRYLKSEHEDAFIQEPRLVKLISLLTDYREIDPSEAWQTKFNSQLDQLFNNVEHVPQILDACLMLSAAGAWVLDHLDVILKNSDNALQYTANQVFLTVLQPPKSLSRGTRGEKRANIDPVFALLNIKMVARVFQCIARLVDAETKEECERDEDKAVKHNQFRILPKQLRINIAAHLGAGFFQPETARQIAHSAYEEPLPEREAPEIPEWLDAHLPQRNSSGAANR